MMDLVLSAFSTLWTAIIWIFFNLIIFGLTLCCKCCDHRKMEYNNVLKISFLNMDRALDLHYYFFLKSYLLSSFYFKLNLIYIIYLHIQSPFSVVAIVVTFVSMWTIISNIGNESCDGSRAFLLTCSVSICGIVLFFSFGLIGRIKRRKKISKNGHCQNTQINHLPFSQPLQPQQPLYETAYMQLVRQQQQQQYVTAYQYQPNQMMIPQILTAPNAPQIDSPSQMTTTEANCKFLKLANSRLSSNSNP